MLTLGKDCTLSFAGNDVTAIVRDAVYNSAAETIKFQPFGQRRFRNYSIGYSEEFEVVFVDDPNLWTTLRNGSVVACSGSAGSGDFVVLDVQRGEPLDDIVTFRVRLGSG